MRQSSLRLVIDGGCVCVLRFYHRGVAGQGSHSTIKSPCVPLCLVNTLLQEPPSALTRAFLPTNVGSALTSIYGSEALARSLLQCTCMVRIGICRSVNHFFFVFRAHVTHTPGQNYCMCMHTYILLTISPTANTQTRKHANIAHAP